MDIVPLKPSPLQCNECLKYLDDPELKLFPGDPDEAVSICILVDTWIGKNEYFLIEKKYLA